jgi:predicted  nucleic acid-binding Zn-ribbon protein
MSNQFDPVEMARLQAKAEQNDLSDEEIEQLQNQVNAVQEGLSSMVEALREPLAHMARSVNRSFRIMTETPHPRIQELRENHKQRHNHTDTVDRCESCGRFLPSGEQRVMCECGTPTFRWDA